MSYAKEKMTRDVENGLEDCQMSSPMEPPQSYHLDQKLTVPYEELARPLQALYDEHCEYLKILEAFEKALIVFRDNRWRIDAEISKSFSQFFSFVDQHAFTHNLKEEKALFPVLKNKLLAAGECSPGLNPNTPTDVMEEEHLRVLQMSFLVFNLLGLANRLTDPHSRETVYQVAMEQGREIVEIMRLHIFKENNVLFPLAQKYLTQEEFAEVAKQMHRIGGGSCSCKH